MKIRATYIGTATLLLEIGETAPFRILTDPAFDPAGRYYRFGFGTGSRKLRGPAIEPQDLPPIDLVLLSHDQHADNLDSEGRKILPRASRVLTTEAGAERMRAALGEKVAGLRPWQTLTTHTSEGLRLTVHAVPARHGQFPLWLPLPRRWSEPVVGHTIGFVIEVASPASDATTGAVNGGSAATVYISGDTVYFDEIAAIGRRFKVDLAFLHLGAARFNVSGPLLYTLNARSALRVAEALDPGRIVPLHFEDWSHFSEGLPEVTAAFAGTRFATRITALARGNAQAFDI